MPIIKCSLKKHKYKEYVCYHCDKTFCYNCVPLAKVIFTPDNIEWAICPHCNETVFTEEKFF